MSSGFDGQRPAATSGQTGPRLSGSEERASERFPNAQLFETTTVAAAVFVGSAQFFPGMGRSSSHVMRSWSWTRWGSMGGYLETLFLPVWTGPAARSTNEAPARIQTRMKRHVPLDTGRLLVLGIPMGEGLRRQNYRIVSGPSQKPTRPAERNASAFRAS
jgi:hypothetical protein